ncbi:MAG: efflux RND transporter periplasmic adaptor subunit [Gemmataceae bacterium]
MNHLQRFATAVLTLAVASAVGAGSWWLITHRPAGATPDKPASPAGVGKLVKEEDLNTVTLTDDAERRIGLAVAPVVKKATRRARVYGGEVTVPAGRAILVAAPLAGTLKAPAGGEMKAGQAVKAGKPVFHLTPLLTPDGRATLSASLAEAEGLVNNAKTQVTLTKIAFDRAKRVHKEGAGSQRQVDEAEAAYTLATKTLDAAATRQGILKKVVGDAEGGTATPVPIQAPEDGVLRAVSALPGQTVPSGAPLFEVIDVTTVWVRVALPVGDLDAVARAEPARVGKLSAPPGAYLCTAKAVNAPPSANPLSATVDVFYEVPNADGKLIPGQRLGVTVPLSDARVALTVPWSAVVFDVHGGTWVYEQVGPHRYARRRVAVLHTVGSDAVFASGPPAGAKVVTAGSQELFGAESGFVK